jgi:hypothetical protein
LLGWGNLRSQNASERAERGMMTAEEPPERRLIKVKVNKTVDPPLS